MPGESPYFGLPKDSAMQLITPPADTTYSPPPQPSPHYLQPQMRPHHPPPPPATSRAGEVPPLLSPLDAFALQSRLLAQKLEDGKKHDRRISRLPHEAIVKELGRPRPDYSLSRENVAWDSEPPQGKDAEVNQRQEKPDPGEMDGKSDAQNRAGEQERIMRHRSVHPTLEMIDDLSDVVDSKINSLEDIVQTPSKRSQDQVRWSFDKSPKSTQMDMLKADFGPGPTIQGPQAQIDPFLTPPPSSSLPPPAITSTNLHLAPPRLSTSSEISDQRRPSVNFSRPLLSYGRSSTDRRPSYDSRGSAESVTVRSDTSDPERDHVAKSMPRAATPQMNFIPSPLKMRMSPRKSPKKTYFSADPTVTPPSPTREKPASSPGFARKWFGRGSSRDDTRQTRGDDDALKSTATAKPVKSKKIDLSPLKMSERKNRKHKQKVSGLDDNSGERPKEEVHVRQYPHNSYKNPPFDLLPPGPPPFTELGLLRRASEEALRPPPSRRLLMRTHQSQSSLPTQSSTPGEVQEGKSLLTPGWRPFRLSPAASPSLPGNAAVHSPTFSVDDTAWDSRGHYSEYRETQPTLPVLHPIPRPAIEPSLNAYSNSNTKSSNEGDPQPPSPQKLKVRLKPRTNSPLTLPISPPLLHDAHQPPSNARDAKTVWSHGASDSSSSSGDGTTTTVLTIPSPSTSSYSTEGAVLTPGKMPLPSPLRVALTPELTPEFAGKGTSTGTWI